MKAARIICIGKMKSAYWKEACAAYGRLLRPLRPVEVVELKDGGPQLAPEMRKSQEAGRLLAALAACDLPVALDQSGRQWTSPAFAQFLRDCDERLLKRPAFIIGGPYGLAPEVVAACRERLSLSAMTWPHELARVLLFEQLYRAESILRGYPYHH
ncbi:MAG: 23S rRNA (pseudouridine(1915)-N(3))-methyltransferase RlmH [Desulfovibrio sp.]|nr:23S rRNA (pseudouridine(1915)-N(3))-methyltransferase RlmH [Desulfovibrio sp.]